MKYILSAFFWLYVSMASGQVQNLDFKQDGDDIVISFYVAGNEKYNVELYYSSGAGQYPIKSYSGDLLKLSNGSHKIVWHVLKDMESLEGEVYIALYSSASSPAYSALSSYSSSEHGPINAWWSVLMPGLGDKYVDGQFGWWTFFGYYTYLASAMANHSVYSSAYDSYQNAKNQSDINYYYETANTAYKNYQTGLCLATAIMAYDVIHVINRGSKNQKNGYKPNYRRGFSSFLLDACVPGLGNISNGNDWGYLTLIGVPMCYILGSNIKYQETAEVQPRDTLIFVGGLWHLFSAIYAGTEAHKLRAQYSSVYQPSPVQYALVPNMYGGLQFCISKKF